MHGQSADGQVGRQVDRLLLHCHAVGQWTCQYRLFRKVPVCALKDAPPPDISGSAAEQIAVSQVIYVVVNLNARMEFDKKMKAMKYVLRWIAYKKISSVCNLVCTMQ